MAYPQQSILCKQIPCCICQPRIQRDICLLHRYDQFRRHTNLWQTCLNWVHSLQADVQVGYSNVVSEGSMASLFAQVQQLQTAVTALTSASHPVSPTACP